MERSDWSDDDAFAFRPPLPPEDRLWRHPSELHGATPGLPLTPPPNPTRRRVGLAIAAGTAGVLLVAALADSALRPEAAEPDVASATTLLLAPATTAAVPTSVAAASAEAAPTTAPTTAPAAPPTTAALVVPASTVPATVPVADLPGLLRIVATTPDGERAAVAVALDAAGTLVTSMTAVRDATSIAVVLTDGTASAARVIGVDGETGTAVLSVAAATTPARVGKAASLATGDRVATPWPSRTSGVVQDLSVRASAASGETMRHLLQVDLPVAAALAEGEPLLDDGGAVIGFCTSDAEGRTLVVPIELARAAARTLVEAGRVVVAWVGIGGGDTDGGALVQAVEEGGPAAVAGVQEGDVVVAVGDQPIRSMAALVLAVRDHAAGETVDLTLRRDDVDVVVQLTLAERPPS